MKRKIISILALFLLTTSILMVVTTVAQPTQKLPVIIGFKRQSDPKLVRAHGGEVTHSYTIITAIAANVPQQAIESLSNNPNVAYLEMDHKVHALEDTLPWGVDRIDAEIVWGGSEGALSVTGNAGEGVRVAVVDTGVDYTHPDLDGNYLGGYDFVNGDDDPLDDNGHGTHVSGTIAAEDNKEGVIGVAPHAGLYALKALDNRGSGYVSDVVAGIEWAVKGLDGTEGNEDDAEVVSMSLGSSSSSTSLKEACNYAYNHGTLPVAAAGNEGDGDCSTTETSYPAAYESVMAVGATDKGDSIASFSNSGDYLELVAPGVDVNSTMPTYDVELTSGGPPWTRYSKNYDTMSGTSMACPHVSGTAALVFAAGATDSNGDGNVADDVRSILDSTAEDLDYDPKCQGNVLVDAEAAVDSTSVEESPTVSWVNPTNGEQVSGSVTIQINASDTEDDTETLTVEWKVDDGSWQTAAYNSDSGYYEDAWDSTGVSDGDHNLDARATDSDGNTTTSSITVTTENTDNAPTVSWVNPQDGDTVQDTVNMKIDASDDRDSGSDLTVKWQVDEGTWQTATYNSTTGYYEATWDSTSVSDGDYNLDARATDTTGNTGSEERITVSVSNEGGGMYVWDVSWKEPGPHLKSTVTILYDSDGDGVAESSDDPVSDATVYYTLTNQDTGDSQTYTGTTDSKGQVEFMWKQAPSGGYEGEVTDLTHSTYTWNSNLDADNPDSYTK